jgi:very-short-patch-repair endonuclease
MREEPRLRIHPALQERARQFRRPLTPPEALLWAKLRNRQCGGFKFRRQVVMGRFIADFECAEAKLIVELDGMSHENTVDYDAARTEWLQQLGYRVIRFTNDDVRNRLESVFEAIAQTCAQYRGMQCDTES